MLKSKKARKKKCRAPGCETWFIPYSSLVKWCSPECGVVIAQEAKEKKDRKDLRDRKQAVKTRSQWLREAQAEFNSYIRARDKDLPCVSCGRHHNGQYHAGHYRTVAACSALRFDERQVWKQCAPCNNHKSGNVTEYRIELVRRIGAKAVEDIEQTPGLKVGGWTIEEAKAIKVKYRAKCRALSKQESME